MKIIRTAVKAAGGITDAERAAMAEANKMWIKRAFRTDSIDPEKITAAIKGLYRVSGLKEPRVVIVPSPVVMVFAYGAASAIWFNRKNRAARAATDAARAATDAARAATSSATDAATDAATDDATDAATYAATSSATYAATDAATYAATDAATYDAIYATDAATDAARAATDAATDAATYDATDDATYDAAASATASATYAATYAATDAAAASATASAAASATDDARAATDDATRAATDAARACFNLAGNFGLQCARRWGANYQGGNMWAWQMSYLSAMRDIIGLKLPEFEKYKYWEQSGIHGGFRVLHEEFCMVCDFPEILRVDDQNRPHCENGPSHKWRDGWALYHWHGVAVPAHWIENRASLDPNEVIKVENVEQRAAGAEIVGWPKMLSVLKAKVINDSGNDDIGQLIELKLPGLNEPGRFLKAKCPRNGIIVEGVPRVSDIDGLPIETAIHAQAWRIGDPLSEYQHPPKRT